MSWYFLGLGTGPLCSSLTLTWMPGGKDLSPAILAFRKPRPLASCQVPHRCGRRLAPADAALMRVSGFDGIDLEMLSSGFSWLFFVKRVGMASIFLAGG